jgi:hypothetical protein
MKLIIALSCIALAVSTRATVISQWTFETSQPTTAGPISPEVGSGTASSSGVANLNSPTGNGSAHSYSGNTWDVGDYWQFQLGTLGFQDILIAFDQTSSSTGPRDFKLAYSTDGSAFTDFQNYTVSATSWSSGTFSSGSHYSFDLSAIGSIENATAVYFRLVDTSTTTPGGGTVASGGTDRVDNFLVSGTAAGTVPDVLPTGLSTAVIVGILLLRGFRSRFV